MPHSYFPDSCRHPALELIVKSGEDWLSIDPGLSGTGIAVWSGHILKYTRNIHFHGFEEWWYNAAVMFDRVRVLFDLHNVRFVCYELPAFMQRSQMQNAKQDIVKLTMFAGMLHGLALSGDGVASELKKDSVFPVRILDWKGQVEKKMMNERTMKSIRKFHKENCPETEPATPKTTHEIDAIGIGLYMLGVTQ